MTIAARVRQLTLAFHQHTIIHDVSLEIPARGISVLVGRSGSGKTTLLRAFNRLNEEFKGYRARGEIYLDGGQGLEKQAAVYGGSLSALRARVGMVFQTPNVLPVSIWRNIALPLEKLTACPRREIASRVQASLEDVGLWQEVADRLHRPAAQLSGGQQQRLCLARTLAMAPDILLLDEPTASLDPAATQHIEQLLLRLADKHTLIMVSHSPGQALRLADRLFIFEDGRLRQALENPRQLTEPQLITLMGII
ncbi:phosphate ABC transporter ATP-binding protein [Entomohabitans teleogrylli]|uniref:phosphate ABC transporter ATP-binding protein n=1 Tax=Entomohabitans teleogrylli TaxID=1384589 RepID=UPI00073D63FC|nr:phosphate ABC transporter ATP-binding protein [Entomohabitans teleogrylli]